MPAAMLRATIAVAFCWSTCEPKVIVPSTRRELTRPVSANGRRSMGILQSDVSGWGDDGGRNAVENGHGPHTSRRAQSPRDFRLSFISVRGGCPGLTIESDQLEQVVVADLPSLQQQTHYTACLLYTSDAADE